MKRALFTCSIVLAAALPACSTPLDLDEGRIGKARQAVDLHHKDVAVYDAGEGFWFLDFNVQDGFCYLTKVGGKYVGLGEHLYLRYNEDGDWYAAATNGQDGGVVQFRAICVPWTNFQMIDGGFLMPEYWKWSIQKDGECGCPTCLPCITCQDDAEYLWKYSDTPSSPDEFAPAYCFLNGMTGKFDGGGEQVSVHKDTASKDWKLKTEWCNNPYQIGAEATCVNIGRTNETGGIAIIDTFYVNSAVSMSPVKMVPVQEGFCWLNHIGGKFRGGAEFITISQHTPPTLPETEWWYLTAQHGSAGAPDGVRGTAYCAPWDQTY